MYQPPHFREDRLDVQHALIRAHPLGLLITHGTDGLVANPIPFMIDPDASALGTLRAHLARPNAQRASLDLEGTALVVFQGVDTYVTPSWYETKRETGKVVPTWNYAIVQAHGRVRTIDDRDWLAGHVGALTNLHEATRARPWEVADAPEPFIEAQLRGIVGLEIEITRIEGKWKVSQNRPVADRAGVAEGLAEQAAPGSLDMAGLVRRYGGLDV